jgi:superfamily I DNA/RNA helicase
MHSEQSVTGSLEEIGHRDHETTSEYRIFGPPGAGKTTNLSRQIRRAVDRYGAGAVLVTSFSRAAAAELAGRDLPIGRERVGTLHSHCWHALGGPEIAEANVDEWNRANPSLAITPAKKHGKLDGEDAAGEDTTTEKAGDEELQRLSRYRGLMIPCQGWPRPLLEFEKKWTEYKRENGLLDFTDLIESSLRDITVAPKAPSVIFADEAQDLNRMQLTLVRKWGERANYFIVAGDDDQTIYSFTGATPDAFLDPDIPADHKIILKQSYRVPRAVHQFAETLIRQVTRRQEKIYLPRPEDGAVERLSRDGYRMPEYSILRTATEHLGRGQSVMFLAACSYMLRPLIQVLRKEGIPFHNPYRKSNGFWNPLRVGSRASSANRVLALLAAHSDSGESHRPWTFGDLALWTDCMHSNGTLRQGAKKQIAAADPAQVVTAATLNDFLETDALDLLIDAYEQGPAAMLDWWRARVKQPFADRVRFPVEVARRRGVHSLVETPQVVVGTIHSVKGGQAGVVYLFPDLSQAGDAQYRRDGLPRDSVIRQFYVGVTRAREKLYLCGPQSFRAVSI